MNIRYICSIVFCSTIYNHNEIESTTTKSTIQYRQPKPQMHTQFKMMMIIIFSIGIIIINNGYLLLFYENGIINTQEHSQKTKNAEQWKLRVYTTSGHYLISSPLIITIMAISMIMIVPDVQCNERCCCCCFIFRLFLASKKVHHEWIIPI